MHIEIIILPSTYLFLFCYYSCMPFDVVLPESELMLGCLHCSKETTVKVILGGEWKAGQTMNYTFINNQHFTLHSIFREWNKALKTVVQLRTARQFFMFNLAFVLFLAEH